MTEMRTNVRVLQSGKVYRQMFDAEVQLMKSLSAKNNTTIYPNQCAVLPEIASTRPKSNNSNLTSANILTERQRHWKDGMPNDFKTENPVIHRQLTTAAAQRAQATEVDIESRNVQGLPDFIKVTKVKSDVIQRIENKRKERHTKALDNMNHDLSMISNRVEPRITSIGENLHKQLKENNEKIESNFSEISEDENLVNFSFDQLNKLWDEIEQNSTVRRKWIKQANTWFNQVEDERLEAIAAVLKKYTLSLNKISFLPSADIQRLIEKEAMLVNQSILANRRAYAKLDTNLCEQDITREITQHRTWAERQKDWKKLNAEVAVKQFMEFMTSEAVTNPSPVNEVLNELLEEQTKLNTQRLNIMEKLKEMKPPSSTKPSVYKWNTGLTKAHEDIDKLHLHMVQTLHEKYEATCQICLTEIEKYKQNLLLSKVCDEEEMRRIVNDHLLPLVGNQLRTYERKLEKMDKLLEQLAGRTEKQLRKLFKFAQGASHLWDVHEIGLAKQERKLQSELEQTRQLHDGDNQERESRLDIALDRLRQESSDEALALCFDQCMEMLSYVKEGYEDFHETQMTKVSEYPDMVGKELAKYENAVCKFFNVNRTPVESSTSSDSAGSARIRAIKARKGVRVAKNQDVATSSVSLENKKRKEKNEEDESEFDKVVREILTTEQGTSYYVLTKLDSTEVSDDASSSDDTEMSLTFITEGGSLEQDPMPDYIKNVFIETSYIQDLINFVRMSFLNHLENWKERAFANAEASAKSKHEELISELDLRLHLHAPRTKRIDVDVKNVRAAELVLHRERVIRHCRGITAALSTLKHDFGNMTKDHDVSAVEFRVRVESMETTYTSATKSTKLVELTNTIKSNLESYNDNIKTSLREFRQKLDSTLQRLRDSNAHCVKSFKLFSEGGNFSPEESVSLRKKLDKISQKVDAAEGAVMKDLEGMESKRIEQAGEVVAKFEEKFRNNLVDLVFVEKQQRWLTNSQLRIKTEVAYSNGMAAEAAGHLTSLKRKVNACEKPNIDKEVVTPQGLRLYIRDIMASLNQRSLYLNCTKPFKVPENKVDSQISLNTESTHAPTSSTGGSLVPSSRGKPSKNPNKGQSRQGVETQGTVGTAGPTVGSRVGSRQPTDDSAIGVIKNILRAQKGKNFGEPDDAKSYMTGTTKLAPSSSNSQIGGSRQHGRYQRQPTLTSIAGSMPESESNRLASNDGGASSVYRRRETKFEAKYMIFGVKPPEGNHFMAKIYQILYESLDGMLSTAEIYYKQKGHRATTRPQLIQDSFDLCAKKVVEKLAGYENQTENFHNQSLQDFRHLLKHLEEELCEVPRLIFSDLLKKELKVLSGKQIEIESYFKTMEANLEAQKSDHKNALRPTLGHPDQEVLYTELSEKEAQRQEEHLKGISGHSAEIERNTCSCALKFVRQLAEISHDLLQQFDDLITVDDVIEGRLAPHKEHTSVLLRRKNEGYNINEVADPHFGVKSVVERGPKQWLPCDVTTLCLPASSAIENDDVFDSGISEIVATNSTTLPHVSVVEQRDFVLSQYSKAHRHSLSTVKKNFQEKEQAEQRWSDNWKESILHVKNLYN